MGSQFADGHWQHGSFGAFGPLDANTPRLMAAMGIEIMETTFLVQPPVAVAESVPNSTLENLTGPPQPQRLQAKGSPASLVEDPLLSQAKGGLCFST
jgi:hypothetical protein